MTMYSDSVTFLQALVALDTGGGDTEAAAGYVTDVLGRLGLDCELYIPMRGMGNAAVRLPGRVKDTVLLLSHLDTADTLSVAGWRSSPSTLTRFGKRFYGRGTLDCKGLTAVHMACMASLAAGARPYRTVMLAALADEEQGGRYGAQALLEQTGLLRDVSTVIGEGGGFPIPHDGRWLYTVQTGERSCVKAVGAEPEPDMTAVLAKGVETGFYNAQTVNYCMSAANADPAQRRLPQETFYKTLADGENSLVLPFCMEGIDTNPALTDGGTRAPDARLLTEAGKALKKYVPQADILPYVTSGYSDNRYFRQRGIDTIGFFPLAADNGIGGIHGVNEYITRASLELSCSVLTELVSALVF